MSRVLVVDDHATNRELIVSLLSHRGHESLQAADGLEALAVVRGAHPDLVICDILMPTMDGYEFVRQLRADAAIADTQVIFYTATFLEAEARGLALSCGVSQVLVKPCEPEDILVAIDNALSPGAPAPVPARPLSEAADPDRDHRRLLADTLVQKADELERTNRRLSALTELNLQLASERDPHVLLDKVCRGARDLIGARFAVLGVKDTAHPVLTVVTTSGMAATDADRIKQLRIDVGVPSQVMLDGIPRRFFNPGGDPLAVGLSAGYPPVHSGLIAPIVSLARSHGWIFLIDKLGADSFSEDDERLLSIHAAQAGRIYENGSLYLQMQHNADKLQSEINERKAAAEKLRESELRFRQLAENIREVFFLINPDATQILYISPAYEEVWGRTRESLYASAETWKHAIHPDDLEAVRRGNEERDSEGGFAYDYRIVRPDGSLRWISARGFPILDAGGEVYRIAGIAEDVTERVRLAAGLQEREAGLRRAQDLAKLAHVITRPDGSFESWSDTLPHMAGLAPADMPASTREWLEIVHPEDRPRFRDTSIDAGSRGVHVDVDYRLRRGGDGGWIHVHQEIEPLSGPRGADGKGRWFSTLQDVTEQKTAEEALRESDRRFGDMLDNVQLVSLMLDSKARITYANDYLLNLTGWRRAEVLGKDWFELFIPRDLVDLENIHADLIAGEPSAAHHVNDILTRSGERRLIQWNNTVLRTGAGETIGTASIGEDITDRKSAEEKIRRLNRVHAVLSGINALIVRVRVLDDLFRESCRIALDAGAYKLVWIAVVDASTQEGRVVASAGEDDRYFAKVRVTAREEGHHADRLASRALRSLKPVISNDVATDASLASLRDELLAHGLRSKACFPLIVNGAAVGVLTLCSADVNAFDDQELALLLELAGDISFAFDHIRKEEKLNHLAYYDALTGLANGTLLGERLEQTLAVARAERQMVAYALLDLERFRTVNHSLGRHGGDALLRQVAERLGHGIGGRMHVARIGADHFAVVVADVRDAAEVGRLFAEQCGRWFTPPFHIDGHELRIAAKVGITLFPADGADAETLHRNAEAAVRKAKAGADQVLFYDARMTEAVAEKLVLENKLRRAMQHEEFVLHYQPKVDLDTRRIVGVEALMRWNNPEIGLVPPLKFISLLEETGLIVDAGLWAIRQAARDRAAWGERGLAAPRVAVNVSAVQLRRPNFVESVEAVLKQGTTPHGIDIELTESLIMDDIEGNIAKMRALHALDVRLAIDDFGTGYSSLAYLAKLPAQALKIDRAFIQTMLEDPDNMTLVSTMISLAHSLRMQVVAEGVETEEQAKMLRLLRCDQMQGYLVSRPLPFEQMAILIREWTAR